MLMVAEWGLSMEFRKATAQDADRIMEIVEIGRKSLASLGIDQWQGSYPNRAIIEHDIAQGETYVATAADGHVVSTAMMSLAGEPTYDRIDGRGWLTSSDSAHPRYAVIHRVAADGCTKGAGMAAVGGCERLARQAGCESVRIDTHEGNVPMIGLIEKRGYTRCGRITIDHSEGGTPIRAAYELVL